MKIIGLDVGEKRIGVAKADTSVKIAVPDGYVAVDNGAEFAELARLARLYDTDLFVLGLPRSNEGNETKQSAYVRDFAKSLEKALPGVKIRFQDESLTSVEAESRLKARKTRYARGEIDAEAASIILQDFIESNSAPANNAAATPKAAANNPAPAPTQNPAPKAPAPAPKPQKPAKPAKKPKNRVLLTILTIFVICGIMGVLAYSWYANALTPVYTPGCAESTEVEDCRFINFTIDSGDSVSDIARALENAGLVKNAFAFELYARLGGHDGSLKAGVYSLQKSLSVAEIVAKFVAGETDSNVFSFTIRPGETLMDISENLVAAGYSADEVAAALAKPYDLDLLKTKPADVSLEGYLYGDTYEFYKGEKVETIILRALSEMDRVVKDGDFAAAFEKQGLTLHEGLTLASIVQKEAKADAYPTVAQVFLTRLRQGMALGSDVTAAYALDLVDPDREVYSDNAAALAVDSPYNTRKYAGLPPGPISSPSRAALAAVAAPADTSYLYFLTGDDGKMYYSYTESEHQQNAAKYCKELCNVSL